MVKRTLILLVAVLFSVIANGQDVMQLTTATSGTVNVNDTGQNVILIHDASTTLTLTIAMPANPFNGQRVIVSSNGGITTLSLTSVVGTLTNTVSTLAAGGVTRYIYNSAQGKWYKY